MIKIELEKKLRKVGATRSTFECEYSKTILDFEHRIVSTKNGTLVDRFDLGMSGARLLTERSSKLKLEQILLESYRVNRDIKRYISTCFRRIANVADSRALLEEIILLSPEDMSRKVNTIQNQNTPLGLAKIFDYSRDNDKRIRPSFTNLEFKICIYCNRNYTSNFVRRNSKRATFTLDHYYQKDKLPVFSLSLYNLIPSCSVCNTNIKNTREVEHYKNPHSKSYDFHNKAKFKLLPNYKVKLVTLDLKCHQYIKDFYINEVYETHSNEIREFVRKREIFTNDMILKLSRLTGHSESRIKSYLFGDSIYSKNIGEESLGKLKADLGKEIGLT